MPAKFLVSQIVGNDLKLRIHTDTTKLDAEGQPDAGAVRELTWGLPVRNQGEAKAAYRTRVQPLTNRYIAEAKLLIADEKRRQDAPNTTDVSVLTDEGAEF